MVEVLLRAGADLSTRNRALMKAAEGGKVDVVRILLEANASPRTERKIKGSVI